MFDHGSALSSAMPSRDASPSLQNSLLQAPTALETLQSRESMDQPSAQSSRASSTRPSPEASGHLERRSSTRSLALSVHSVLNPDDAEPRGRRRSASHLDDDSETSQFGTVQSSRPSSSGGTAESGELRGPQVLTRRILNPVSPHLNRSSSITIPPTGHIDAQQTPFLPPPGTGASQTLPAPQAQLPRQVFASHHGPNAPHIAVSRRQSVGAMPTATASPAPTFSPYNRSGQASPALPGGPGNALTPPQAFAKAQSPALGAPNPVSQVGLESVEQVSHHRHSIPVVSQGQNNYELMTINTRNGIMQIPVEVHVGSKAADEKRRRNAGASARFRIRRKEKEREAAATIARLQRELSDMTEDCDHYRRERDVLVGALSHIPGTDNYFPRPQSPRHRRTTESLPSDNASVTSPGGLSAGTQGSPPALPGNPAPTFVAVSQPSGRNARRRTDSGYQLTPSSSDSLPPAAQVQPASFPNSMFPQFGAAPPQTMQSSLAGTGPNMPSIGFAPHGSPEARPLEGGHNQPPLDRHRAMR